MRTKHLIVVLFLGLAVGATNLSGGMLHAQTGPDPTVRNMQITGEIAKSGHQYIIRGKVPAEIFTILNPCPDELGKYLGKEGIALLQVRIVSGDNVEIETIDGNPYCPDRK